MVGWTIFRASTLQQAGGMLSLMARPFAIAPATRWCLSITGSSR